MAGSFLGGKNELASGRITSGVNPLAPLVIWRMNEGSGTTLNDTGGHADTATISPGTAVVWQSNAGLPGTTPMWNGTGQATAASTTLTNFEATQSFSVSAWVNATTLGGALVSTLSGANTTGWGLELVNAAGPITFFLISNFGGNNLIQVNANSGTFSTGTLHNVVATYTGTRSALGVKIYVDGVAVATTIIKDQLVTGSIQNGVPANIGARPGGTVQVLNGAMAFVRIYNFTLSSTQVATLFANGPQ